MLIKNAFSRKRRHIARRSNKKIPRMPHHQRVASDKQIRGLSYTGMKLLAQRMSERKN